MTDEESLNKDKSTLIGIKDQLDTFNSILKEISNEITKISKNENGYDEDNSKRILELTEEQSEISLSITDLMSTIEG